MLYHFNRLLIGLLVLVSLTAGTCDDGDDEQTQGLSNRDFVVTEVTENGEIKALVKGTTISVKFHDDARLTASAGCNTISGNYEVVDGKLQMEMMGMTEMGCDQPLHDQDEWLSSVLSANPALTLSGDELVLEATLDDGTAVRLELLDEEVAIPDKPLVGTLWYVDTIIDGAAASNGNWEKPASIEFGEDGSVKIFAGCNSGSSTYTVTGETIVIASPLAMTEMACTDEAETKLEAHVLSVLAEELTFEIDQNRLTLMAGNQGLGCTDNEAQ